MQITSRSFTEGGWIPAEHSADGVGTVPPLMISGVPADAVSLAIVSHDPDVPRDRRPDGNFDHWVVWNVPAGDAEIVDEVQTGGVVGVGTTGQNRWIPCAPPPGSGPHRYYFTAYALDVMLDLEPSAGRVQLERAIEGHAIATAQLMGRYQRD